MKPQQWRRTRAGRYLRHLPRIKHVRGTWLHRRFGDNLFHHKMWQPDRARFAAGGSVGAFFSMMPLPFQMLAAALIAFLTRVNIPAAIAYTWISNPFTAPFLLYAQYKLGFFLLGKANSAEPPDGLLDMLKHAPLPVLVGAFAIGAILALVSYPISLFGWDWVTKRFLQPVRKPASRPL